MATIENLKAATALIMGDEVAALYDAGTDWSQRAFKGEITTADFRILAMPRVLAPYNKAIAFYTHGHNPETSIICFMRHYIGCGMVVHEGASMTISEVLLHEMCHAYQRQVSTETRWRNDDRPHRDGRWFDAVRVASSNLWADGQELPIEIFNPRRKGALFSDVEMHHFPAGFEQKIRTDVEAQSGQPAKMAANESA